MRRQVYLEDTNVEPFVEWLRLLVRSDNILQYSCRRHNRKLAFFCKPLWQAYTKYSWRGADFDTNQRHLDVLSRRIKHAISEGDEERFVGVSSDILRWGNSNPLQLHRIGECVLPSVVAAADRLNPLSADSEQLCRVPMGAGWSKVYSLILNDFPIYDGRVGAAMGYLVRHYYEQCSSDGVAKLLHFRWSQGRSRRNRDPSSDRFKFGRLGYGTRNAMRWAECNLWTAWILGEVRNEGKFGDLPKQRRLRALEAALFMAGHELPE